MRRLRITMGDLGLFSSLLASLSLDAVTSRRLALAMGGGRLASMIDPQRLAERRQEPRGLNRYSACWMRFKGPILRKPVLS